MSHIYSGREGIILGVTLGYCVPLRTRCVLGLAVGKISPVVIAVCSHREELLAGVRAAGLILNHWCSRLFAACFDTSFTRSNSKG